MSLDVAALLLTFGAIFVVELPDKTFLATLVLATRYRPILVWLGVGAAFTVQTAIAVVLGGIVPEQDRERLLALGVKAVFGPGRALPDIAHQLLGLLEASTRAGAP